MRFADLNTTTEYAYRPGSKYGVVHKIRVQDAEKLWRRPIRRTWMPDQDSLKLVPARKDDRANSGSYNTARVGVLISYVDNPGREPDLALPAKILSTWEDFLSADAEEKELARKAQQARNATAQKNEQNAARIQELLTKHPEISGIYASPHDYKAYVPYPVLIQLLEALAVPTADV